MILKCLNEPYITTPTIDENKLVTGNSTVKIKKTPIITRISVQPEQILVHQEDYDKQGRIYKNRCIAHISGFGNLILNHSFDYIEKIKQEANLNLKVNGFGKQGSKSN